MNLSDIIALQLPIGTDIEAWASLLDALSTGDASGLTATNVGGYDLTTFIPSTDIGVTVQGYDANLAAIASGGSQPAGYVLQSNGDGTQSYVAVFDPNAVHTSDIGTTVQAPETSAAGYGIVNGAALDGLAALQRASGNLTAVTGTNYALADVTPLAVGTYRLGGYLNITSLAGDLLQLQASFNDENGVYQTQNLGPVLSLVGSSSISPIDVRVGTGADINISAITAGNTTVYDVGVTIEQLN